MFTEIVLAWIAIGLFSYCFAMFGMDRFFGEWQQDLLRAGERSQNPTSCPNCKKNLTTWFSQCVECRVCGKVTCRACADYCMGTALWTCSTCVELQERGPISSTSRYWHPEPKIKDLTKTCTAPGSYLDHNTRLAFKKIELFASDKLGTNSDELNTTRLGRVYTDPSYDLLFTRWHGELSDCIKDLVQATTLGTDTNDLERELYAIINQIRTTTMDFPQFEVNQAVSTGRDTPSYPDILSTAILNRIIINGQDNWVKSVSPVSNDSAVGTDFNSTSELGGGSSSEKDTQHWVLASNASSALERSDEESLGSNWSEGGSKQIVIQESLEEEITTTTYESDGESEDSESPKESGSDLEEPDTPKSSLQNSVANWEHNWLFKRRKELLKQRNALKKPVQMLVPNPNTDSEPMIGDEKVSDIEDFEDYVIVDPKDYESDKSSRRSSEENVEPAKPTPKPRQQSPEIVVSASAAVVQTESQPKPVAVPKPVERIITPEPKLRESSSGSGSPTLEKEEPEETLRETSHSLSYNETIEFKNEPGVVEEPTQEEPVVMRIAAREKEKWNHPVKVEYNPYAPENLNKRLKEGHHAPVGSISLDAEDTTDFAEKPNIDRFRRDYYVNQTKPINPDSDSKSVQPSVAKPKAIVKSSEVTDRPDLDDIHLPSVKNLAMRFNAGSREDLRPAPRHKLTTAGVPSPVAPVPVKLQVHSLTARSVSKQFREGLKLSKPATTNHNVKLNSTDTPVISGSGGPIASINNKSDFVADKAKYWDERVRLAKEENNL